jgi:hypothetical protein
MIDQDQRGYLLEHVLTKIRYLDDQLDNTYKHAYQQYQQRLITHQQQIQHQQYQDAPPPTKPTPPVKRARIQIIGLSATMPNVGDLCTCLAAARYGNIMLTRYTHPHTHTCHTST